MRDSHLFPAGDQHDADRHGRARYMERQRNPYLDEYGGLEWQVLPETAVWSDYDRDVIYGDYVIDPATGTLTNKTAYLPGIGQLDNTTGVLSYFNGDHLGTLRATTDASGNLSGFTILTAFGEAICGANGAGDCVPGVPSTSTRYQYAGSSGYETALGSPAHGGSTGQSALPWQHVGHRWYDPSTGRFLQRDPIGIGGGLNVYVYCDNNPLAQTDANGLMSPPPFFGPPAPTGPADRAMFDPVWSKVHYGFGVGAGLLDLTFWQTTCLAVKWEFWEPDHWPDLLGRFNESYRNQVGDIICAQRGWFDGQRLRQWTIRTIEYYHAKKELERAKEKLRRLFK